MVDLFQMFASESCVPYCQGLVLEWMMGRGDMTREDAIRMLGLAVAGCTRVGETPIACDEEIDRYESLVDKFIDHLDGHDGDFLRLFRMVATMHLPGVAFMSGEKAIRLLGKVER